MLEDIPNVLCQVFKEGVSQSYAFQQAKLGNKWSDVNRCGKWLLHNDRCSGRLGEKQKRLLESGCSGKWDVTLLAHALCYSSHLLLVDPTFPFLEASIKQNDPSKLIPCLPGTDFTKYLRQRNILVCDFGQELVRIEVKRVDRTNVTLMHPVKQKPPRANFRIYLCSADWVAVEKLSGIRNKKFAHCKDARISTQELQDVVQDVEKLYVDLRIQQQDIQGMKNILKGIVNSCI